MSREAGIPLLARVCAHCDLGETVRLLDDLIALAALDDGLDCDPAA
jgi:hypothetical protein